MLGPSQCGKTSLVFELIKRRNEIINEQRTSMIYIYGVNTLEYHKMKMILKAHQKPIRNFFKKKLTLEVRTLLNYSVRELSCGLQISGNICDCL